LRNAALNYYALNEGRQCGITAFREISDRLNFIIPSGRYKSAAHILNMGWHRVTVFGDCRKQLMDLFKMKGLKVIQEDKEPVI
jgi:hypothetical protein